MSPAPKTRGADPDPQALVPLTPLAFHILLSLADEPRHGYAIIRDIEKRTEGAMNVRSGTLYTAIQRLESDGLLEPAGRRAMDDKTDRRRRYYRITSLGRRVARLESVRIAAMLSTARAKNLYDTGT